MNPQNAKFKNTIMMKSVVQHAQLSAFLLLFLLINFAMMYSLNNKLKNL